MEPQQIELLRQTIVAGNFELAAVGCDNRSDAATLSEQLGVPASADLRHALESEHESIDLLWLLAGQPLDEPIRDVIRRNRVRTITTEPRPQSLGDVATDPGLADLFTFVPQMAWSDGFMAARAMLEELGTVRCVSACFTGGPAEGSITARLYDALHAVTVFCGEAMGIHASTGSAAHEGDAHAHLWMSVNVTFPAGQSAALTVRRGDGPWNRRLIVLGDNGLIEIDDRSCHWLEDDAPASASPAPTAVGELIARQIHRMAERHERPDPPIAASKLLALCEAAKLSCRTGQVETPGRMIEALARI